MLPLILLSLVALASAKGPHHPTVSHHHYHPQPSVERKLTNDERVLHDKQHIKEDLGDWSDDSHLTDEEMEFRYFKVHDFDNNTKLDGLEIYQAIKHSMESSNMGYGNEQWSEKESTIIRLIDQVLLEDDTDNDGYLSYAEYVIGRQNEKDRRH